MKHSYSASCPDSFKSNVKTFPVVLFFVFCFCLFVCLFVCLFLLGFFLGGQVVVVVVVFQKDKPAMFLVSVPPPCYRSST